MFECECVFHRYVHTSQFFSHLAVHLQGDLGGDGHEGLRAAEGARDHTLAGRGALHTQLLLHTVVLILAVRRQDHHHLDTTGHKQNKDRHFKK